MQRSSQLKSWSPSELADYVACTGQKWKPGSGQQLASSVRSFLRFLLFKGLVQRELAPAIPSFANWRLSRLPAVVDRKDLERLVSAVDPSTPIGMRDRGALLCMIELGLRASDVAAITTDGIDLSNNVLRLGHAKERRVTELPMTSGWRLRYANTFFEADLAVNRPSCSSSIVRQSANPSSQSESEASSFATPLSPAWLSQSGGHTSSGIRLPVR